MREGDASLRQEIHQELAEIRTLQIDMVQRLSRIEGFLGIGLPPDTAPHAPGTDLAGSAGTQDNE